MSPVLWWMWKCNSTEKFLFLPILFESSHPSYDAHFHQLLYWFSLTLCTSYQFFSGEWFPVNRINLYVIRTWKLKLFAIQLSVEICGRSCYNIFVICWGALHRHIIRFSYEVYWNRNLAMLQWIYCIGVILFIYFFLSGNQFFPNCQSSKKKTRFPIKPFYFSQLFFPVLRTGKMSTNQCFQSCESSHKNHSSLIKKILIHRRKRVFLFFLALGYETFMDFHDFNIIIYGFFFPLKCFTKNVTSFRKI